MGMKGFDDGGAARPARGTSSEQPISRLIADGLEKGGEGLDRRDAR
jgi:hypothetical protein